MRRLEPTSSGLTWHSQLVRDIVAFSLHNRPLNTILLSAFSYLSLQLTPYCTPSTWQVTIESALATGDAMFALRLFLTLFGGVVFFTLPSIIFLFIILPPMMTFIVPITLTSSNDPTMSWVLWDLCSPNPYP